MRAYKFLGPGRVGLFSDFAWPAPGEWVETHQPVIDCVVGVHALRADDLLDWIDDELWEVELRGDIVARDGMLVAESGRLTRRIETWDAEAARGFADACARRAADVAVQALRRAGLEAEAAALEQAETLEAAQEAAVVALDSTSSVAVSEPVSLAADLVSLVRGQRPDAWGPLPATRIAVQSPGAVAANAAFVAAHAIGRGAVNAAGTEDAYAAAFAAERARQLAWFQALLPSD